MKRNPFIPNQHDTFNAHSNREPLALQPPASGSADSATEHPAVETDLRPSTNRLVRYTGAALGIFLLLVLFVFREIQHTREKHHMSRLVSSAEAAQKACQEKLRLEEGRSADLMAALHSQQALTPGLFAMHATRPVPVRWR